MVQILQTQAPLENQELEKSNGETRKDEAGPIMSDHFQETIIKNIEDWEEISETDHEDLSHQGGDSEREGEDKILEPEKERLQGQSITIKTEITQKIGMGATGSMEAMGTRKNEQRSNSDSDSSQQRIWNLWVKGERKRGGNNPQGWGGLLSSTRTIRVSHTIDQNIYSSCNAGVLQWELMYGPIWNVQDIQQSRTRENHYLGAKTGTKYEADSIALIEGMLWVIEKCTGNEDESPHTLKINYSGNQLEVWGEGSGRGLLDQIDNIQRLEGRIAQALQCLKCKKISIRVAGSDFPRRLAESHPYCLSVNEPASCVGP